MLKGSLGDIHDYLKHGPLDLDQKAALRTIQSSVNVVDSCLMDRWSTDRLDGTLDGGPRKSLEYLGTLPGIEKIVLEIWKLTKLSGHEVCGAVFGEEIKETVRVIGSGIQLELIGRAWDTID